MKFSKSNHKKSLRWSMIRTLVAGWVLPLVLLTVVMLGITFSMINRQIARTIRISTENAVEICMMRLQEAETLSKNASYIPTIRESYRQYLADHQKQKLSASVTAFLNQQYKYDANLLCTMLFFDREPEEVYYTYNTYQDNNSGYTGYHRSLYFKSYVQEQVLAEQDTLDTGLKLLHREGHLYLVRNLVDSSFHPYAMLVLELDPEIIFGSLESIWGAEQFEILLDGEALFDNGIKEGIQTLIPAQEAVEIVYGGQNAELVYQTVPWKTQTLTFAASLDRASMVNEVGMIRIILGCATALMIPLFFVTFRFFEHKVNRPIAELTSASGKVAQGEYGFQVKSSGGSEEFAYLCQAFNKMSSELQYQFETIYQEELALKDANIKALQSQINPHFLNNTLEIINWEARMQGNDNVSDMIGALATMLSATLNRKQSSFVTLAEELTYVDAYLYIISRRFGERFQVSRHIDNSLLEVMVPILIIQPIVENAVEHGVEANRRGKVEIRIFRKEDMLYIQVENDGNLTEADRKKIDRLLQSEENNKEDSRVSIGIRNVNRRLKIIYGEECGLTITNEQEKSTISTLVVKMQQENKKSQ